MASSLEECDEMMRAQRETGCYLGVISQNRYLQDNRNLKNMIASGAVGRPCLGRWSPSGSEAGNITIFGGGERGKWKAEAAP